MLIQNYYSTFRQTLSISSQSFSVAKLLIFMLTLFFSVNIAKSQSSPILSMTTQKKVGEQFAFLLRTVGSDTTTVEVDFGNGTLIEFGVGSTKAANIKGALTGQTVKVYGGESKIKIFSCNSMGITSLDASNNPALITLFCNYNQLSYLDVSKNPSLVSLHCTNNKLTFATLPLPKAAWSYDYSPQQKVVLPQKDYSSNEEIDLKYLKSINNVNTRFTWKTDLEQELISGQDYINTEGATHFLTNQIDSVYCEMTHTSFPQLTLKTSEIKVTKNITGAPLISMETTTAVGNDFTFQIKANADADIQVDFGDEHRKSYKLYASDVLLIDEELKGSTVKVYGTASNIIKLDCSSNNITKLDVSEATYLRDLDCSKNKLTSLDVKDITDLTSLICNQNNLTKLEFNDKANSIICSRNNLTFETLPLLPAWYVCVYAPQKPLAIAKSFGTTQVINLSEQKEADNKITLYTWKTKGGKTLTEGVDYSVNRGKTVFLKPQTDSVYCEMSNAAFPDFKGNVAFTTTNTWITGTSLSVISMTTTKPIDSEIKLTMQAYADNTTVYVDFGTGTPEAKTIHSEETTVTGKLLLYENGSIKVYSAGMYYLDCSFNEITSLDISKNQELTSISCNKNKLTALDISQNPNLTGVDCEENQLTSIDVSKNTQLTWLSFYDNRLASIDLSKNTELLYLDVARNLLSNLDITKNTKLTSFSCADNNLTTLDVSQNPALFRLESKNNKLTFATLAIRTMQEYRYFPQQPVSIAKQYSKGAIIDLSALNSAGNANTVFTLKTKGGATLVKGTDYNIDNGKITFLQAQTDSIYCAMTNATFPYMKGNDALTTSYAKISDHVKQSQTISFDEIPNKKEDDAPFKLKATATSGLVITFSSSDPGIASISNDSVFIHKAGNVVITASQSGNEDWDAATAEQPLTITPLTAISETKDEYLICPNPVSSVLSIKLHKAENVKVSIYNQVGTKLRSELINNGYMDVSDLQPGVYYLQIENADKANKTFRFVKI